MPCYRLFFRDPATGRFVDSELLDGCDNDGQGVRLMADRLSARDIELWERSRLVATLHAAAAPAHAVG